MSTPYGCRHHEGLHEWVIIRRNIDSTGRLSHIARQSGGEAALNRKLHSVWVWKAAILKEPWKKKREAWWIPSVRFIWGAVKMILTIFQYALLRHSIKGDGFFFYIAGKMFIYLLYTLRPCVWMFVSL